MSAKRRYGPPVEVVRSGHVSIPVYWWESKGQYVARWTEHGRKKERRGADLDKLKAKLKTLARALEVGAIDFTNLTSAERAVCSEVLRRGITVDDLAGLKAIRPVQLTDAISQFLESKSEHSSHHYLTLRTHLNQLAAHFPSRAIGDITPAELDQWLKAAAFRLRTRRNKRASIVSLWRWCRDKGLVEEDARTAAERTDAPSTRQQQREKETPTWSPEEIRIILSATPAEYLPLIVLSAFAGIRTGEIVPDEKQPWHAKDVLQWEHFDLPNERIVIPAAVSKTARKRVVPILPVLRSWLDLIARPSGQVLSTSRPLWRGRGRGGRLPSAKQIIEQSVGPWRHNALRHSYGTYRVIATQSVGAVALEMGNSEDVVKSHYLDIGRTTDEAAAWFATTPDQIDRDLKALAG